MIALRNVTEASGGRAVTELSLDTKLYLQGSWYLEHCSVQQTIHSKQLVLETFVPVLVDSMQRARGTIHRQRGTSCCKAMALCHHRLSSEQAADETSALQA
jgi:hypothetical protein